MTNSKIACSLEQYNDILVEIQRVLPKSLEGIDSRKLITALEIAGEETLGLGLRFVFAKLLKAYEKCEKQEDSLDRGPIKGQSTLQWFLDEIAKRHG